MQLPRYSYRTNNNFLDYEFGSIGPKGHIKKVVRYTEIRKNIFNPGFDDLDEETGEISVTNNNDSRKVLATVASTVQDFTLQYQDAWIIAKGSIPSRTRLYRMGISNHWQEINKEFEVFGLKEDEWQPFELRKEYDA